MFSPQSESEYLINPVFELLSYFMQRSLVPLRYRHQGAYPHTSSRPHGHQLLPLHPPDMTSGMWSNSDLGCQDHQLRPDALFACLNHKSEGQEKV